MEYFKKYFVKVVMFVFLTSAILSWGENELKEYSAAILVKDRGCDIEVRDKRQLVFFT
jgi:hypothetical protein